VGSGIPFVLGDEPDAVTVLLHPMRLKDWGAIEQTLLLERKRALALTNLSEEQYEVLKDSLKQDRSINMEDLIDYASTVSGAPWRLWLSLRQEYPYWQCLDWVDALVAQRRFEEYLVAAAQADGIDLFANLDWPKLPFQEELSLIRKSKKQEQSVDWKLHISAIAEGYHISPAEVGELTYYQARVLLWDRESLQGNIKLTPEEFRNVVTTRKARKFYEEKLAAQQSAASPSGEPSIGSLQ
jgi:hypothetical protein